MYFLATVSDKPKRSDEKENVEPISVGFAVRLEISYVKSFFQAEPVSPEAQIHLHVDDVSITDDQKSASTVKEDAENLDQLSESLQDLIIEYRRQEQQKRTIDDHEEVDDDDDDDANFQRILNQIGVSLHKKYREKSSDDPSKSKLSDMIQQLYQTLKKTQPGLFTRTATKKTLNDQSPNPSIDQSTNEEVEEIDENDGDIDEEVEQEAIIPLTPEMERANGLFDQGQKFINVTFNRQYDR